MGYTHWRVSMRLNEIELKYYKEGYNVIVGVDEAGRGPIAGPVVAAAVILPKTYYNESINDSKSLSDALRRELFEEINKYAIAVGIGVIEAPQIDELNIYVATQKAMGIALENLKKTYDLVLSDAMPLLNESARVEAIIKGDENVLSIAAASIIAKVTRDNLMEQLHETYPDYGFNKHKGYATKKHIEALRKHGPLKGIHRYTYEPVKSLKFEQIKLF